jgi:hypothetical protein
MKEEDDNIDLSDSGCMDADQQALFLDIQRSKSADSFLGKLLPQAGDAPERSLVFEMNPHFTHNILVPQTRLAASH